MWRREGGQRTFPPHVLSDWKAHKRVDSALDSGVAEEGISYSYYMQMGEIWGRPVLFGCPGML